MKKYSRYKNRLEMFLSSERGKRVLNFLYSWGASIVVLGALFKLLHLPYANQILFVAMITESVVFFISAFERPSREYHWEDVFPTLDSKNPMDRPSAAVIPEMPARETTPVVPVRPASEEEERRLSELTEATQRYLEQLAGMSANLEQLNQHVMGLNSAYETQLMSLKAQMDSMAHINQGLDRMCEMYDGSVMDSSAFRNETERMARQLAELNQIYGRLLQAMTVNMGYQSPYGYQQPPYPNGNNPMK